MCFFRRRELSSSLIALADKHQREGPDALNSSSDESEDADQSPYCSDRSKKAATSFASLSSPATGRVSPSNLADGSTKDHQKPSTELEERQRFFMNQRELFLSRQVETLPATHIRGKCSVTLLNETESSDSYINKENCFFYSLVYETQEKTLLADRGEIRIGSEYQAEIQDVIPQADRLSCCHEEPDVSIGVSPGVTALSVNERGDITASPFSHSQPASRLTAHTAAHSQTAEQPMDVDVRGVVDCTQQREGAIDVKGGEDAVAGSSADVTDGALCRTDTPTKSVTMVTASGHTTANDNCVGVSDTDTDQTKATNQMKQADMKAASTESKLSPADDIIIWSPSHNLSDSLIDQFMILARSVGTFARALDCHSSVRQPSLHMSASSASRDITLLHAMHVLHRCDYDLSQAMCQLVPACGPLLCRDEMEDWSASEANLFEEALEKFGKDFNEIRQEYLPWKSHNQIVEYYYMWKTTDRYVQQKRVKAVEAEARLKQVYIPNYNSKATAGGYAGARASYNGALLDSAAISCYGCGECHTTQWFPWSPDELTAPQTTLSSGMQESVQPTPTATHLCSCCWDYWKRYAGLRRYTSSSGSLIAPYPVTVTMATATSHTPLPGDVGDCVSLGDTSDTTSAGLGALTCTDCERAFANKNLLARHLASVHGHVTTQTATGAGTGLMTCSSAVGAISLLPSVCRQRAGAAAVALAARTRPSFCLVSTLASRAARVLCPQIVALRKLARRPVTHSINLSALRAQYNCVASNKTDVELRHLLQKHSGGAGGGAKAGAARGGTLRGGAGGELVVNQKLGDVSRKLLTYYSDTPGWLQQPPVLKPLPLSSQAFPCLPHATDVHVSYTPIAQQPISNQVLKRPYTEVMNNGFDGMDSKRLKDTVTITPINRTHTTQLNGGRNRVAAVTRICAGRQKVISLTDTPEDVFHIANDHIRELRRHLGSYQLHQAARRPWRLLPIHNR